ncbi:MAG: 50S ribosomal protein L1, partial [bacterium]|nr:50S ribosomal protein L1 [bacterium]
SLGLEAGDQEHQIRTFVSLPHGTGKTVRVLVFAEPALAKKAEAAGADLIGDEALIEKISSGKIPAVDAIVSTPSLMPRIAKAAKILGPKGLMPTPKNGTVTADPAKTVAEIKKGKAEIRTEAQSIVHVSIGKVSFADEKLIMNLQAVIEELNRVKPAKIKDVYLKSIVLAPTMGPSVRVALDSV